MDATKLIETSHNRKLTVATPEKYDDKELEIMIISSKEKKKDEDEKIKKQRKS